MHIPASRARTFTRSLHQSHPRMTIDSLCACTCYRPSLIRKDDDSSSHDRNPQKHCPDGSFRFLLGGEYHAGLCPHTRNVAEKPRIFSFPQRWIAKYVFSRHYHASVHSRYRCFLTVAAAAKGALWGHVPRPRLRVQPWLCQPTSQNRFFDYIPSSCKSSNVQLYTLSGMKHTARPDYREAQSGLLPPYHR
jgi:hypothetical protein